MLIKLEDAKLRQQFKKFKRTGVIPEAIYAGQSIHHHDSEVYWAKCVLAVEEDNEYNNLIDNLRTCNSDFKYPYTLSKYRRGMNPVLALYQEYQKALFSTDKTKFDVWVIDLYRNEDVRCALHTDISNIQNFLDRYRKTEHAPSLLDLQDKLCSCLAGFNH